MNSSFLKGLLGEQDNRLDDGGVASISPPMTKMQRICTPTARKPERPNQGGASDPNMGEGCESTFWSKTTFKLIPSWFSNSPVGIPWASTGCTGCRGLVRASLNRGAPHAGPPPGCPWTPSPSSPPPSAGGPQASCPPFTFLFSTPIVCFFWKESLLNTNIDTTGSHTTP